MFYGREPSTEPAEVLSRNPGSRTACSKDTRSPRQGVAASGTSQEAPCETAGPTTAPCAPSAPAAASGAPRLPARAGTPGADGPGVLASAPAGTAYVAEPGGAGTVTIRPGQQVAVFLFSSYRGPVADSAPGALAPEPTPPVRGRTG